MDTFDKSFLAFFTGYFPVINGSDTNFSHPFVLTYPANGFPTDKPRPQLQVRNLTGFSNGIGRVVGTVIDTQLWGELRRRPLGIAELHIPENTAGAGPAGVGATGVSGVRGSSPWPVVVRRIVHVRLRNVGNRSDTQCVLLSRHGT